MKKTTTRLSLVCTIALLAVHAPARAQIITTIAGTSSHGYNGDGIPATTAQLNYPVNLAVDRWDNVYIADYVNNRVRKINTSGVITTYAGNGTGLYAGDGGPATAAQMVAYAVAVDTFGNVFVDDYGNNRIRKITPAGIITTVAGNGFAGSTGDGGPATDAKLASPNGVAIDPAGNIYISSPTANTVRKVSATTGIISAFAGTSGGFSGDGGPATDAKFNSISHISTDLWGNVYVTDDGNHRVRKINTAGIINTIAGSGTLPGYTGDGGPATAALLSPTQSSVVDVLGNVYIADGINHVIRMVDTAGIIITYAGNGTGAGTVTGSFSGDGGPATAAGLDNPVGTAVDRNRNLYIADYNNHRVRKVTAVPVAFIAASKDTICKDSCITFINTGLGTTDSIRWVAPGHTITNPHANTIKVCYSATGSDTVSLYMYNVSGSDTAAHMIYVHDCHLGVDPDPASDRMLSIFPNPATNSITVAHAGTESEVSLYTSLGQLVYHTRSKNEDVVIDTHQLPAGIYCIRVTAADNTSITRTVSITR